MYCMERHTISCWSTERRKIITSKAAAKRQFVFWKWNGRIRCSGNETKTKTNEIKINQHFNEKGIAECAYATQKERCVLTIGCRRR